MRCKIRVAVFLPFIMFLIVSSTCIGMVIGYRWGSKTLEEVKVFERENLAERLDVENNWDAIRQHIYCVILETGKKPEQIKEDLEIIGPFFWDDESYQIFGDHISVYFENYFTRKEVGNLMLYFDEQGYLTGVYKMVGIGDMMRLDDKCEQ